MANGRKPGVLDWVGIVVFLLWILGWVIGMWEAVKAVLLILAIVMFVAAISGEL
jgi:hypothetical protein